MYQSNNQHSCFDCFIYGNDLRKLEIIHNQSNRNRKWQIAKKDFTLLLIALFCSSLAHAQKQVPAERKDSIDNGSNIIKIVGNHSNKGAANNALDVLSGQAAGVNVTSNGLDRMSYAQ